MSHKFPVSIVSVASCSTNARHEISTANHGADVDGVHRHKPESLAIAGELAALVMGPYAKFARWDGKDIMV